MRLPQTWPDSYLWCAAMQNMAPKQEWAAPRIVRLDQLQNTETGSNLSICLLYTSDAADE